MEGEYTPVDEMLRDVKGEYTPVAVNLEMLKGNMLPFVVHPGSQQWFGCCKIEGTF